MSNIRNLITEIMQKDFVNFSSYAGMYSDGAHAVFRGSGGETHTIYATGDRPRKYFIDGEEVSYDEAKRMTRGKKLNPKQGEKDL